ncbi:MAG: tRNA uridine-5-carboxymethylaminomethyl(34) synthesis GTPase MnmE, partial [Verrucomicrobia bacterium]|nr:tRNA uridine-5-carboxymethylaminomethyl(34) synthesis GTPase MnmE [Verrucomicrobiota bacterium]
MIYNDTIAAISTPIGEGALGVIRLSGPQALEILKVTFHGAAAPQPRRVHYGEVHDQSGKLDSVLVTYFQAPKSYTGEDVVEVSFHGGILLTQRIFQLFLQMGARAAGPGEFTQRAFLNGKMDLTQAEGVLDLIKAQTDLALRAANEQLSGRLGQSLIELREKLLTILAHVEAYIDFPDDEIDPDTGQLLIERVEQCQTQVELLLSTAEQGRVLRHGLRTVIFGAPNVGKSSLLNLLLGYDRAIVSAFPGTTRDTIEEVINVRGIPVRLIDTAGIRESNDQLENEGIRRMYWQLEQADLLLCVVDGSQPAPDQQFANVGSAKTLLVLNKIDLGLHPDWTNSPGIRFSCTEQMGKEELNAAIWTKVMGGGVRL